MSKRKEQIILENLKYLFNQIYRKEKSESYKDLFREAFSNDYPEEANPDGPVSLTEMKTIAKNLNVGPGKTFVDLGCGRGGAGLWIARETGANYIGIDFAENAIEGANHRAKNFKIKGTFEFQVGDMCSLNLPENSVDGAISIDALAFLPDPITAIKEAARILRSKTIFIFTSWEHRKSHKINDYRPHLLDAGFEIKNYTEIPEWKQRQQEVYEKTLELKDVLIKDMGRDGAFSYIMEAQQYLPILDDLRRILAVAMKI